MGKEGSKGAGRSLPWVPFLSLGLESPISHGVSGEKPWGSYNNVALVMAAGDSRDLDLG